MNDVQIVEHPTYYPKGVKLVNAMQHSVPADPRDMDAHEPTLYEYGIGDDGKIYQWIETCVYDYDEAHVPTVQHYIKGWFEKGDRNFRKAIV